MVRVIAFQASDVAWNGVQTNESRFSYLLLLMKVSHCVIHPDAGCGELRAGVSRVNGREGSVIPEVSISTVTEKKNEYWWWIR